MIVFLINNFLFSRIISKHPLRLNSTMAAPSLKDLPKVAIDLKSQLESFSPDSLKNASTEEKFVLPTAEGKN